MRAEQKKKMGLIIMTVAFVIWIADRFSHIVSTTMGQMVCGDTYMKAVDGVVGDCSCGFNTDMHLAFVLVTVMVLGFILIISSKRSLSLLEHE